MREVLALLGRGLALSVAALCVVAAGLLVAFEPQFRLGSMYGTLPFAGGVIFLFAVGLLIAGKSLMIRQ